MEYHKIVDYSKLDPFKKIALEKFSSSLGRPEKLGFRILKETLGESAIAIDFGGEFYIAFNVEGLGTKNIIAEEMYKKTGNAKYFENIGIDTVAMSTNDLSSIGAEPFVYGDIISSGSSDWFTEEKTRALLEGYKKAAEELGIAIPCGETPTLQGIVYPETLDLAGAAVGAIRPKENLTVGQRLKEGDVIFGFESSGIHSNGVSLARKIAEGFPEGFFTELPSGKIFGEELLKPTRLYSGLVAGLLKKTEIHYFSPITGHGWKKIMRAKLPFSYEIDFVPEKGELFSFLQEKAKIPDFEAYYTWNMGLGYAAIAPKESSEEIFKQCKKFRLRAWELGRIKKGEKKVEIKPKKIVFLD
ncbi:MAG: AIR synthase-related protein [Candidatus ainarchaeum sp.]|nr:AIR synthase-related protein [Candidatus ainarchaeum sp.]